MSTILVSAQLQTMRLMYPKNNLEFPINSHHLFKILQDSVERTSSVCSNTGAVVGVPISIERDLKTLHLLVEQRNCPFSVE